MKDGQLAGIDDQRPNWLDERRRLEADLARGRCSTPHGPRRATLLRHLMPALSAALRLAGLYRPGRRNALDLRINRVELALPGLPAAFDGYRILFVSDLHAGNLPEVLALAAGMAEGIDCDLAVLGGDYQTFGRPGAAETARLIAPLVRALRPADGILAVLGNHDTHQMVPALEGMGVRVLVNQWAEVARGGERLRLVGLDDVHSFYTPAAKAALARHADGFRVALIHSPDGAALAAAAGCGLMLAGHTHGGQICLPGGRPLMTSIEAPPELALGPWAWGGLKGYTSSGLGASEPTVRFNSRPELALLRLAAHGLT